MKFFLMHVLRSKFALVVVLVLESKKKVNHVIFKGVVAKCFSVIQNVAIVEFSYYMGKFSQ